MPLLELEGYKISLPYLCFWQHTNNEAEVWCIREGEARYLTTVSDASSISVNHDTGHIAWFDCLHRVIRQVAPDGTKQEYSIPASVSECGVLAGHNVLFWYNQAQGRYEEVFVGSVSGGCNKSPGLSFLPTRGLFVVRSGKAVVTDAILRTHEALFPAVVSSDGVSLWKEHTVSIVSPVSSVPQANIYSCEMGTRCEVKIVNVESLLLGKAVAYGYYTVDGEAVVEGNIAVAQFLHLGVERVNGIYVFRRDKDQKHTQPRWAIPVVPSKKQVQIHIETPYVYTVCKDVGQWVVHVLSTDSGYLHSFFIEKGRSPRNATKRIVDEMKEASDACEKARTSLCLLGNKEIRSPIALSLLCTRKSKMGDIVTRDEGKWLPWAIRFWWQQ